MDLDEELARYIAAEDGVTNWDSQPATYQQDMMLYAQAAVRFFRDRMPGTVPGGSGSVLRASFQDIRPDDPRITELIRVIDRWEAQHGIRGSSVHVARGS